MTMPKMIERPSPNIDARPAGTTVDLLLLHYTGMKSAAESLDRLCDPAAKVSAHYLIDEDGTVWRLVDEAMRAWHAGVSHWAGATDINARSVGIELQNPGHEWGYRAFPEAQMAALIALAHDIVARHAIAPARVLGHADVAPTRKQDPGELFDWRRLAAAGIGVWPGRTGATGGATEPPDEAPDEAAARALLIAIGYDPAAPLADVITAFQRHWRQDRVDGVLDAETMGVMRGVIG